MKFATVAKNAWEKETVTFPVFYKNNSYCVVDSMIDEPYGHINIISLKDNHPFIKVQTLSMSKILNPRTDWI